jgi:uncharacterized membrane protein YphA (DoxX/SURF4 family)
MARMVHLEPLSRDRVAERDRRFQRMAAALAGLRILAGLIWLENLRWKLPPDFGNEHADGLQHYLRLGADHGLQPFAWVAGELLVPHETTAGWFIFWVELIAGLLLLTGYRTGFGAALGTLNAIVIAALVGPAPGSWHWGYVMLVAINVTVLVGPANLRLSVDALAGRV